MRLSTLIPALCLAASIATAQQVVITGKVVDENHRPLPAARIVHVISDISWREAAARTPKGMTGEDGSFSVRLPEIQRGDSPFARPDFLVVEAEGRVPARLLAGSLGWIVSGAREGETRDVGTIPLPRGVPIQCRIRNSGGRPIQGARILAGSPMNSEMMAYSFGYGRATYSSEATTDAKGAAVVHGLGRDGVDITVVADGYYDRWIPVHGPGMPLVVTMRKGGHVLGKVVDHDGKPLHCVVRMRSEVAPNSTGFLPFGDQTSTVTDEDGSFRLNVAFPHRFRIYALPTEKSAWASGGVGQVSAVLDGPKDDVVIRFDEPEGVDGGVVVAVVDAATGKRVESFRAAMIWQDPEHLDETFYEYQFATISVPSTGGKKLLLAPPSAHASKKGALVVKAPGYATKFVKPITWRTDEPVRRKVELEAEVLIEGVVTDAKTGDPIQGAGVRARAYQKKRRTSGYPDWMRSPVTVFTDAKGAFRIHGRGPGEYEVIVRHDDHPEGRPHRTKLAKGAPKLKLQLDHGLRLSGKITGAKHRPGWRLELSEQSKQGRRRSFPYFESAGRTKAIGADGSFAFRGLANGTYVARLIVPRIGAQPFDIEVPEKIVLGSDEKDFELDISGALPGRVRGKVTVKGVPPPLGRLVISAESQSRNEDMGFFLQMSGTGTSCTVARDGTFDLLVKPGTYRLLVMDAASRAVLLRSGSDLTVGAGKAVPAQLDLELAMVRVKLTPTKQGGVIAASKLAVHIEWEKPKNEFGTVFAAFGPTHGIPLDDGRRDLILYLPNREVKLTVATGAAMLATDLQGQTKLPPPLAEKTFTPKMGEINRIEIAVKPPPAVQD